VDLDMAEGPKPVAPPVLETTSDVVERALGDAERLIATQDTTSGLDRVHTSFHGYLRALASDAGLQVVPDANITELFKAVRERHPRFQSVGPRQADIDKIMRSAANIVDTLNPLRNLASVAHPNEALLESPEAMLVINSVRSSLLHYLYWRTHASMGNRPIRWTMLKAQICLRRGHIRSWLAIFLKSWASRMSQDQGATCNQRNGGICQGVRAGGLVCLQDARLPMLSQQARQALTVHLRATPPFLVIPRPARKRSGTSIRPSDRDRKTPISTR